MMLWLPWWMPPLTIAIVLLALAYPSHGAIDCNVSPDISNGKRWLWRDVDSRKCWFTAQPGQRRGQDQPREELRWPAAKPIDDLIPQPAPTITDRQPWELEHRWRGAPPGWEHRE